MRTLAPPLAGEFDRAALAAAGAGADDAAGVDRGVEGAGGGAGGQDDAAAADVEGAAVRHLAVAVDGDAEEAVAGEVEGGAAAAGEGDGAALGDDGAGVLDVAADQRREAGAADGDAAFVDDARAGALAAADGEAAVALEAFGVDGLAGGDEAAGVDAGGAAEDDAGAVLDDDGARRADRAFDEARLGGDDAVQGGGVAAGLGEGDGVVAANVEAPPVDHRPLRALADGGSGGAAGDLRRSAHHRSALRAAGAGGFGRAQRQERDPQERQRPRLPRRAAER